MAGAVTYWVDGMPVVVSDAVYSFGAGPAPVSDAAVKLPSGDAARLELWRTQPAIRTVTGFIARNLAQVPLHAFVRGVNGDRVRLGRDEPLSRLLREPDRLATPFEHTHAMALDVCLWDRYAAQLFLQDDGSWRLVRLPPERWRFVRDSSSRPSYIEAWRDDGTQFEVPLSRALWVDGYPSPADTSPIASLLGVLQEEAQAAQYRAQLWANGGRWSGWVSRPVDAGDWSDRARSNFKGGLRDFAGAGGRAGEIPIFEEGMSYHESSGISPEDGQQLESRRFSTAFVMAAFHVAPALLNLVDGNYSNVKAFREALYADTLGSWFQQLGQAWNVRLVPQVADPDRVFVEFNVAEKLRVAFEEQARILQTMTGGPIMTRAEARSRLNLPYLDGTDELVVPLNVVTGGQASPTDSGDQNRS
jgi:HK97 family phage portal protein